VTFDVVTEGQLVVVAGMHVWSVCEHHLLPFEVTVSVGYVPVGRVLGLSKFARLAQRAAHKLQIQERLIEEISIQAQQLVQTEDVAVLGIGRHLCMEARGPKTRATTTSFATSGTFARRAALRRDFLQLCALGVGGRPGIE
jgi:GTP cyclohydrolase I